jgi:hypothetical protein
MPDFWTLSGWLFGAVGVVIAFLQIRKTKRINERNLEQMMVFLDRANYVAFEHELVDEVSRRLDGDHVLIRNVASWHQAGCDLYIMMVDYYLSQRRSFTWRDLEALCKTPIVTYRWQEEKWRAFILQRKENKQTTPPDELFLKAPKTQRLWYYKRNQTDAAAQ